MNGPNSPGGSHPRVPTDPYATVSTARWCEAWAIAGQATVGRSAGLAITATPYITNSTAAE